MIGKDSHAVMDRATVDVVYGFTRHPSARVAQGLIADD